MLQRQLRYSGISFLRSASLSVALVSACVLVGLTPCQLQAQNITLAPIITTVVGTGTAGCTGSGGPATSALLTLPGAMLDRAGNLYVTSGDCNTIRVVNMQAAPITVAGVTILPGYIATVAGTGTACPGIPGCGDGGPATNAQLTNPHGIAQDSAGNIYIVDTGDNVVRVINSNGIITTFAGNGTQCPDSTTACGDGGPASSAQFHQPLGIKIDSAGNLYIGDELDYRVRKIGTSGTITTVIGTGTAGSTGDGGPATSAQIGAGGGVEVDSAGNLYFADFQYNVIRKVNTSGIISTLIGTGTAGYTLDGSSASNLTPVNSPHSTVLDSAGNLYFEDAGNNIVRKINTSGIISTIAGNYTLGAGYSGDNGPATSAQLNFPVTLAFDSAGNFYIGDFENNVVRKVNNGPANFGQVNVLASSTQNVFLSINTLLTLSSVQTSGDYSVTGDSCALNTSFSAGTICTLQVQFTPAQPGQRWFPLVLTDSNSNKYSFGLEGTGVGSAAAFTPGIISTVAGNGTACSDSTTPCGDGGAATSAEFSNPTGVVMDGAGNLYVADNGDERIRVVNMGTAPITVAGVTIGAGNIGTVAGDGTRGYSGNGVAATSAELYYPGGVTVDNAGNLYIADTDNALVRKVDVNGPITTFAGAGAGMGGGCATATDSFGDGCPATSAYIGNVSGVMVDASGNVYIADWGDSLIRKVDLNGIITSVAGNGTAGYNGDSGAATSVELQYPSGMAFDSTGNLYIADTFNHRVRMLANGTITTVAGSGPGGVSAGGYSGDRGPATEAQLNQPRDVAVDSAGNLYIADAGNYLIRKVDTSGIITTVAGDGSNGVACAFGTYIIGDGCPATSVFIGYPEGVAVDGAGDLYIADGEDNRIRKVSASTSILAFGSVDVGQTSSIQTVGVSDVGNNVLNLFGIAFAGNFQTAGSGCTVGTPVGIGQTCELGAVFAPVAPGSASGTITLTDDAVNSPQVVSLSGIGLATPMFSNLTPSQSIVFGTSSITLSGTISAPGPVYPPSGETVSIGIGGLIQNATIGVNGSFSMAFNPSSLLPAAYAITYRYSGDSNFASASDSSTSLTVAPSVVYFTLTLTELGTGAGTVTDNSSPLALINCSEASGSVTPGSTCSASYASGTTVILTANPNASPAFGGWGATCTVTVSNQCSVVMSMPQSITADFVAPPASVTLPFSSTPGTNVTQTATFCPDNSNPCANPNAHALTLQIPQVTSDFSLTVTATEVDPDGLCPPGGTAQSDFDCRFVSFFNYGTDLATGDTVVPLCYPYANGNCVHYDVYYETPGQEPSTSSYSGGVFWKIGFNNTTFVPGSYWTGSTPRMLDDPDANEFPEIPYGTDCSTPMTLNGSTIQGPIYCQFDADITTFVNSAGGLDPIGGKTIQANDVVVAFLPTSTGSDPVQTPAKLTAPAITSSCVNGCVVSGTTITFTEGTGGTFAVTPTGFPAATLTESGTTLPNGLTFNAVTGLISGTPADGTSGSYYPITFTATNSAGSATLTYTLTVTPAGALTITASSPTITYGGTVPAITASGSGFVNGDTITSLTTPPTCSVTVPAGNPVGTYTTTCSGAVDANYSAINYVSGTLTVNPAAALTITASSATITYGGAVPTIIASYNGFVNGETATTTPPTCTTAATSSSPVGTYITSCSGAVDANYTAIKYVSGALTVNPAALTITASSGTMTYGGTVPTITPIYSGFVNGDTVSSLTSKPTCSTTATSSSPPGNYTSSCSGAADANYTITYVNGTVTVSALEISPTSLNFGTLYLGQTGIPHFVTVTNTGSTSAVISSVMITGGNAPGDFGDLSFCTTWFTKPPGTLPPGKSCVIGVDAISVSAHIFSPTASTAYLTITPSGGSPLQVPLTALVINPQATFGSSNLSSGKLTFPTTPKGKTSALSVTVTNTGNTPLTLGTPTISSGGGPFAVVTSTTTCTGATVEPPGAGGVQSCVINVTFTPTAAGTFTGTLKITDNAENSPQTITLSGTT
jgi:sugar lactone lactonase YvrE